MVKLSNLNDGKFCYFLYNAQNSFNSSKAQSTYLTSPFLKYQYYGHCNKTGIQEQDLLFY